MYWLAYYESLSGFTRKKRFGSEEDLDAWLDSMADHDPEGNQTGWKKDEDGGEIKKLNEVYRLREPRDIQGHTVTLFRTPKPEGPLLSFLATRLEYLRDAELRQGTNLYYGIYGCPEGTPEEEREEKETLYALMSEKSFRLLLQDDLFYGDTHLTEKCWAKPLCEGLPEGLETVCLRTDWQLERYDKARKREKQQGRIESLLRQYNRRPRVNKVIQPHETGDDNFIFVAYPDFDPDNPAESMKNTFGIRPTEFEKDFALLAAYLLKMHRKVMRNPGTAPVIQPTLFDNLHAQA